MAEPTVVIDARGVTSEADFWQRYLDASTPDGAGSFGRNLDAFWDAITAGGPGWPGNVSLSFINMADIEVLPNGSVFLQKFEALVASIPDKEVMIAR